MNRRMMILYAKIGALLLLMCALVVWMFRFNVYGGLMTTISTLYVMYVQTQKDDRRDR